MAREFSSPIKIAPLRVAARQRGGAEMCQNLVFRPWGLAPIVPVSHRYGTDIVTGTWPFPQQHRGQEETLAFGDTTLQSYDEAGGTVSTITTYDQADAAQTKAIISGGPWHIADAGRSWFAFNGQCVVFRVEGLDRLHNTSSKVYVQNTVSVETGCFHKSRFVFGGFNAADFWTNLSSILSGWDTDVTEFSTPVDEVGQNYVMWSSIGGGDFPLWLFFPQNVAYTYDLAPTAARLIERVRENTFGLRAMEYPGKILRLAPLGRHVIAYGEDGIAALTFEPPNQALDRPPTYGYRTLSGVGIVGRGAVGVGRSSHIFVDARKDLWLLDGELNLQRLGYREFVDDLGTNLVVFRAEQEGRESDGFWYVNGSDGGLLLTGSGASTHSQRVTSADFVSGAFTGISDALTDRRARYVSEATTLRSPGRKLAVGVVVSGRLDAHTRVALEYRLDQRDFVRTPFRVLNGSGYARLHAQGEEFKIVIEADDYSRTEIDGIDLLYQRLDKRLVRGTLVGAVDARTDS